MVLRHPMMAVVRAALQLVMHTLHKPSSDQLQLCQPAISTMITPSERVRDVADLTLRPRLSQHGHVRGDTANTASDEPGKQAGGGVGGGRTCHGRDAFS